MRGGRADGWHPIVEGRDQGVARIGRAQPPEGSGGGGAHVSCGVGEVIEHFVGITGGAEHPDQRDRVGADLGVVVRGQFEEAGHSGRPDVEQGKAHDVPGHSPGHPGGDQRLDGVDRAEDSEATRRRHAHFAGPVVEGADECRYRALRPHVAEPKRGGGAAPRRMPTQLPDLRVDGAARFEVGGDPRQRLAAKEARVAGEQLREHLHVPLADGRDGLALDERDRGRPEPRDLRVVPAPSTDELPASNEQHEQDHHLGGHEDLDGDDPDRHDEP